MTAAVENDVEVMFRLFRWRMTSNYVPEWDLERIREELESFDDWCRVFSSWANRHRALGDAAVEAGDDRAAAQHYVRAGLFYHWASFQFPHEPDQFREALANMAEVWRLAAPRTDPPMEPIEVPFEEAVLPAYIRRPTAVDRPPVVILVPGIDSTKEELFNLTEFIVERGVAAVAIDGPGQGAVSFEHKFRPDGEAAIRAFVDHLWERPDLDMSRLAVGGISFGAMFACKAAAFDERVTAAVSVSGWHTPSETFRPAPALLRGLRHYLGADPMSVVAEMSLTGIAERIRVPLLQVYGGLDHASPPEQAHRVEREAQGETTTIVYDEGVHVCNNVWYKARPLIARWLAETLKADPA
jgi:dienelactone hydrolase